MSDQQKDETPNVDAAELNEESLETVAGGGIIDDAIAAAEDLYRRTQQYLADHLLPQEPELREIPVAKQPYLLYALAAAGVVILILATVNSAVHREARVSGFIIGGGVLLLSLWLWRARA